MARIGRSFPARPIIKSAWRPAAYTLAADKGTYTLTGIAAGLQHQDDLQADQGAYVLTGNAVALQIGHVLNAARGQYTLTGNAANLLCGRVISGNFGQYLLTGNAAAFSVTAAPSTAVTPSVGSVGPKRHRRQRYLIEGRHLMLTEDELRTHLMRLLRRKQEQKAATPVPQKAKPAAPIPDEPITAADFGLLSAQMQSPPTYIQVADDLARQSWALSQPEIIGMLQQLALGMERDAEEDDEDVLLLMH